jgi:hypothetical protein
MEGLNDYFGFDLPKPTKVYTENGKTIIRYRNLSATECEEGYEFHMLNEETEQRVKQVSKYYFVFFVGMVMTITAFESGGDDFHSKCIERHDAVLAENAKLREKLAKARLSPFAGKDYLRAKAHFESPESQ